MNRHYIMLLITLMFSISLAYAFTFDNSLSFDKDNPNKLTITNSFGLGSPIVSIEKVYNTDYCFSECWTIWNVTIYDNNPFIDNIKFQTQIGGYKNINYKFEQVTGYETHEIPIYNYTCSTSKQLINETMQNVETCIQKLKETKIEQVPIWQTINPRDLRNGNYLIKLTGFKNRFEDVDWIPTYAGKEIRLWSWWFSIRPNSYYKLNEGMGNVTDSGLSNKIGYNIFNSPFIAGKLNNATWFNNTISQANVGIEIANVSNLGFASYTIALWFNATQTGDANARPFLSKNDHNTDREGDWFIAMYLNGSVFFTGNDDGGGITNILTIPTSAINYNNSQWQRLVITRDNSTNINSFKIYVNNTLITQYNMATTTNMSNTKNLSIGMLRVSSGAGRQSTFNMTIDDVQFYYLPFSASDVNTDWNGGIGLEADAPLGVSGAVTFNIINYTTPTYTLKSETFGINITYNKTIYTSSNAYLVYNGTSYLAIGSTDGINDIFVRTITMPLISTQTIKNFYWNISLQNTTGIFYFNSSVYQQTINPFAFDNCTANNITILDYRLYDEDNQNFLSPLGTTTNATIEIDVKLYPDATLTNSINFSLNRTNNNPVRICIDSNVLTSGSYQMDAQAKYYSTDRVIEYNNIQNYTLTSLTIPVNISLYDLAVINSQSFLMTYRDMSFNYISDAVIEITRKYVGEGVFKLVEAPKTDSTGRTISHLVTEDALYTFIVKKNGKILSIFENMVAVCQDPTANQCTIDLTALETSQDINEFNTYKGVSYDLTFNQTTRIVKAVFSSLNGVQKLYQLNVSRSDNRGNAIICATPILTTSGILTCVIPSTYGNTTIYAELLADNVPIVNSYFNIKANPKQIFGYTGYFMAIFLYMTLVLMFVSSSVGIVIGSILGVSIAILFNLIYGNIFSIGSTLTWFVIAGAIILWRISKTGGVN